MGCACVKRSRVQEDLAALAAKTIFNRNEVEALHELYRNLSRSIVDDGFIHKEELRVGLFRNWKKQCFFADRIFDLLDTKHDGLLDFEEFVEGLSIFHPDAPQEEKITFLFELHDISKSGFIEANEVKKMIIALLDESDLVLSDDIIQSIVDKAFEEVDSKKDGKIDPEEWRDFVATSSNLLKIMTIPYLKDITTAFPSFAQKKEADEEIN